MFLPDSLKLPGTVTVFVDVLIVAHIAVLVWYLFTLSRSIQNSGKGTKES